MNIKENEEIINDKETTDESLDNTNETKKDYIKKLYTFSFQYSFNIGYQIIIFL